MVALRLVALRRRSALAVLRSLTGLLQAVLLALDRTRVTLEEAGLFQDRTVIGVDLDERAGARETQRTGLAGDTATVEAGEDVERVRLLDSDQGLPDELLVNLVREVLGERPAVELELAGAGDNTNPDNGLLATPNR